MRFSKDLVFTTHIFSFFPRWLTASFREILIMSKAIYIGMLALLAGCATTGSTFRSGVGDRQLEHPPYYAGQTLAQVRPAPTIVAYSLEFQRGASQAEIFDPASGVGSAVAALVSEINATLDSAFTGKRLSSVAGAGIVPPSVYFGCEYDATNDCVERGDSVLGRRGTTMKLAVERPSAQWIARHAALLDSAGASHALVVAMEVGQYWTRQKGLRGDKSVELGTNHTVSLPWVTSLETPVSVLQLTGALVDREGRAVRIGAEGIVAVRTPIAASGFGMQRLISAEDVTRARVLRRDNEMLAWKAALCALLSQLGGKSC